MMNYSNETNSTLGRYDSNPTVKISMLLIIIITTACSIQHKSASSPDVMATHQDTGIVSNIVQRAQAFSMELYNEGLKNQMNKSKPDAKLSIDKLDIIANKSSE